MFKLLLIAGHGKNVDGSFDPGAIGCGYREADLTRELVRLISDVAYSKGISCDIAPDRNHYSFFKNGGTYDVSKYSYVLEVHFNASSNTDYSGDGKLKGTMMYIDQSETGHSVEDAILKKLYAIGTKQAWDGVVVTQRQWENGLMVQNAIRKQGVSHAVLETCFVSDLDDMKWYQKNKGLIAGAIIDGIREGFNLNTEAIGMRGMYFIDVDSIYDHCLNIRSEPNAASTITGVITENMTLTITEIATNKMNGQAWGRLLSGAGWINLKYARMVK